MNQIFLMSATKFQSGKILLTTRRVQKEVCVETLHNKLDIHVPSLAWTSFKLRLRRLLGVVFLVLPVQRNAYLSNQVDGKGIVTYACTCLK